jgi:hypothetical protein
MDSGIVQIILGLIGGGLLTGIVAWIKAKPEAARIAVASAEGAVVVQASVIQDLRNELTRIALENERCRAQERELREEMHIEKAERLSLENRIEELENTVRRLGGNPEPKGRKLT